MKKLFNYAGFNLIELVVVILVLGVLAASSGKLLNQGVNVFIPSDNNSTVEWQGRTALERMVRDIRTIRSNADISTSTSSQLVFVNTSGTTMTYQLSGTNLLCNSQVLASGVTSFSFNYYNASGNVTATPSAMEYIVLNLTVAQGSTSLAFSTAVFIPTA